MAVFVGPTEITIVGEIRIGANDVQEIYVGSTKVFPVGAPPVGDFVSQWKTDNTGTSNDDQVTLPLVSGGTYNFVVNWGDGSSDDTITAFDDPEVTHTFIGGAGTFTITITGTINGWRFNNGGDKLKILDISNWGSFQLGPFTTGQFFGCTNLDVSATDVFDTSTATSLALCFLNCTSLTTVSLDGSDTSSVTELGSIFEGCSSLTSVDVSSIDTSLVTSMLRMFSGCTSLTTVDVSGFDTGAVTNMAFMFSSCGNLTTADVSGFNTSVVTNMSAMFNACISLTTIDVSSFDTSLVTDFSSMFTGCSSAATLDVSGFDTSAGLDMAAMFRDCIVTSLALDAANWDIDQVTDFTNFCFGVTLGTSNYDAILAAWAAQSPVVAGLSCSFGSSVYTIATAQADRDVLTDAPNSWTLTDGGGV